MPKTSEISLNISCLHKHESYLYPMLPFEFGIAGEHIAKLEQYRQIVNWDKQRHPTIGG